MKVILAQVAENPATVNLLLVAIIGLQTWIVKRIYALEKITALLAQHVNYPVDRVRND